MAHDLHGAYLTLRQRVRRHPVFATEHVETFDIELADGLAFIADLSRRLIHVEARHLCDHIANAPIIAIGVGADDICRCIAVLMHPVRLYLHLF